MSGYPLTRRAVFGALALAPFAVRSRAQSVWPDRPVRVIVPYPPAGGADTTARIVFGKLGVSLGQQFVIENRGGAGGTIAEAVAAKTKRDSGLSVAAGQVLITNGGKQAVANAFAVLCDPGDEVIVLAPYWTTYPEAIALAGGVPVVVTVKVPFVPTTNVVALVLVKAGAASTISVKDCVAGEPTPLVAVN